MPARSNATTPWRSGPVCGELVVADTREQVGRINGLAHQIRVITGEVTGEAADLVTTGRGSRSGSATGSPPAATTPRSMSPTGRPGPSPPRTSTAASTWSARQGGGPCLPTTCASTSSSPTPPPPTAPKAPPSPTAHVLVGDHTGAASAYVGMTRGRDHNTAHLVAPTARGGPAPVDRRLRPRPRRPRPHPRRPACRRRHRTLRPQRAARPPPQTALARRGRASRLERRRQTAEALDYTRPTENQQPRHRFLMISSGAWIEPGTAWRRRGRWRRQELHPGDPGERPGLGVFPGGPGEDVAAAGSGRIPDRRLPRCADRVG